MNTRRSRRSLSFAFRLLFAAFLASTALPFLRAQTVPDYILSDGAINFPSDYSGAHFFVGGTTAAGDPAVVSATISIGPDATFQVNNSNAADPANYSFLYNGVTYTWAGADGGAISVAPLSTLTLAADGGGANGFLFDHNTAAGRGGAIFVNQGGALFVDSATFSNNVATGNGGAMASSGSLVTITNALFASNTGASGGAIQNLVASATLVFDGVTFRDNYARVGGGNGGGAVISSGNGASFRFDNFLFENNKSGDKGGAITNNAANVVMVFSHGTFAGNSTEANNGGVLFNNGGTASFTFNDVVFSDNYGRANNGGGVICNTANNATFTFNNVLFERNTGTNNGGVIFNSSASVVVSVTDAIFRENISMGASGGVAMYVNGNLGVTSFTNVLFESNTATAGSGGAVMVNSNTNIVTFTSATFAGNVAAGSGTAQGGGALFDVGNNVTISVTNALFDGNRSASNGGAVGTNSANSLYLSFNNVLFTSNTASTSGGAVYNQHNQGDNGTGLGTSIYTDVSFLDNTAVYGDGGAIWQFGGTLTFNVNTSATFAGNTAKGVSNAIYFSGSNNAGNANLGTPVVTFNIAGGASLDMLDPMTAMMANAETLSITKTGTAGGGLWNLGGDNTLDAYSGFTGKVTFTVATGTLHLYRAGETSGAYTVAAGGAGKINLTPATGATSSFTLKAGAAFSAGGGNSITAPLITLENNSTIILDLLNATSGSSAPALLTLNATSLTTTNWSQNLNLLNLSSLGAPADGTFYNLITLTGDGASANLFTNANFLGITGLLDGFSVDSSLDGLTLELLYTAGGANNVLTWNGAASNLWRGANWLAGASPATFANGDIINLSDEVGGAPPANTAINVNAAAGVTIAGLYLSGTESYTLTGNAINASATAGALTGAAATGQLILGAKAAGATTLDTTPAAGFSGTLTLNNSSNNFEGGIIINSGALAGNAASLGAGDETGPGITINAGSLTFDQQTDAAYDAPIAGSGALAKTGPGALTLTANSASFAGTTNINAGALLLKGTQVTQGTSAALGGDIRVGSGATFGGSGTAGNVTLDSGATLQVGDSSDSALQSFSLSALSLSAGSILDYATIENTLLVGGLVTQSGASTIKLGTISTSGSYSLIDGGAGALASFNTSWLDISYKGSLLDAADYLFTTDGGTLWLTILNMPLGLNNVLTWSGAADNLFLASANWQTTGVNKAFADGDIINLNDTALATPPAPGAPVAIVLDGAGATATAAAIYASGPASFEITGAGSLVTSAATGGALDGKPAATGKLILGQSTDDDAGIPVTAPFTGTLSLLGTGSNNFSEGIEIYSGALRVSSADQLGAPINKVQFATTVTDAAAGNTATLIAAGDVLLDSSGASAQRLMIPAATAAAFVVEDGATLTFARNNISGTSGAAIALDIGAHLTITSAGPGASAVFTTNTTTNVGTNPDGGAISLTGAGSLLTLTGVDGGGFLIENNFTNNRGGAIFLNNSAVALIDSATFAGNTTGNGNGGAISALNSARVELTNVLFSANKTNAMSGNSTGGAIFLNTSVLGIVNSATFTGNLANNGGAIGLQQTSTVTINDALFTSNTARNLGGALSLNTTSVATITNSQFIGNVATLGGGAVSRADDGLATASFTNVSFLNNSAAYGGAIYSTGSNAIFNFNNVLFSGNTASANGGAFGTSTNTNVLVTYNLTDVSLLDNTAGGLGGAFYINGGVVLNYNVTTSATIAGNKAAGAANSLYFHNYGSPTVTFNIDAGAHLDMLDPMGSAFGNNNTLLITKTGAGTWNLGGASVFTANNNTPNLSQSIIINQGTLHLYRAAETSYNGAPVMAGGIFIANNKALNAGTSFSGTFALNAGATLSAGGGNTIQAPSINIAAGARFTLDLAAASIASTGYSVLTLSATNNTAPAATFSANNWNQTINLLNLDTLDLFNGDTINLITLAGDSAALSSNLFTNASFASLTGINFTDPDNFFHVQVSADGLSLQLVYSNIVTNHVIVWTGAANDLWRGQNWSLASDATDAAYTRGDIANFTGSPASTNVNVDPSTGVTLGAMYVSGTENYTITGNSITTSANTSSFAGSPASNGQLVLGAKSSDDATTIDTTAAYTGTLTLANSSNNFQGGVTINSGALLATAQSLTPSGTTPVSTAGITIASAGALIIDQSADAGDATYAGTFLGSGALVKTGDAILTLTANSSPFAGSTRIDAGTLLLAPADAGNAAASLGGNITINAAATLIGADGASAGNVTVNAGATLQVGSGTSTLQSFNLSALSLNAGATLAYASITNSLLVSGAVTQNGASTLKLNYVTLGSYSVLTAGAGLSSFDTNLLDISYRGTPLAAGADYLLSADAGTLWLTFTKIPIGLNNVLTWTNAASDNLWLTSSNWTTLGSTVHFVQGDIVNLADTALPAPSARVTIDLASSATATGIYLSGNTSYVITGAPEASLSTDPNVGVLTGVRGASGKLVLGQIVNDLDPDDVTDAPFTGTLDLTGLAAGGAANNFANGVEIRSGVLRISTAGQLGTTLSNLTFLGALPAALDPGADPDAPPPPAPIPATLQIAAHSTITFDSSGSSANRLAIPAAAAANFIVEDGATLTFSNNVWSGSGAAILVGGTSSLTIAAGAGAQVNFTGNNAAVDAAGIEVGQGASLILTASDGGGFLFDGNINAASGGNRRGAAISALNTGTVNVDHAVFSNNYAIGNGGAAAFLNNCYAELDNVLFTTNTGAGGGAILANTGANVLIQSATFTANYATNQGGAISIQGANNATTVTLNDVLFSNNYAVNNGGAISQQSNGAILDITDAVFLGNTAGGAGAAININADVTVTTLTNVSFINNTAATGGAISVSGSSAILNINVTDYNTAIFAGNYSGTTAATRAASSITFAATNRPNLLNIYTGTGATLEMLDPFTSAFTNQDGVVTIEKTGAGTWALGGDNIYSKRGTTTRGNFTVTEGTLYLYGEGERVYSPVIDHTTYSYRATAGSIIFQNNNPLPAGNASTYFNFTLKQGATLSIGGGNTIGFFDTGANSQLNFEQGSILVFDLGSDYAATTTNPLLTIMVSSASASLTQLNMVTGGTFNPQLVFNYTDQPIGTYNLLFTGVGRLDGVNAITDFDSLLLNASYNGQTFQDVSDEGYTITADLFYGMLRINFEPLANPYSSVLTWTGSFGNNSWRVANWTTSGSDVRFSRGDIINLTGAGAPLAPPADPVDPADPTDPDNPGVPPAPPAPLPLTINIDTVGPAYVGGLYVSGTADIILTGNSIEASTGVVKDPLYNTPASTGKLILGAIAGEDGSLSTAPFDATLTLSNASDASPNNFSGGIEINSGHLIGNAAALTAGDTPDTGVFIAADASLTFTQDTGATYASPIAGAGSLDKTGDGALTFTANSASFTGTTSVSSGALLLAASSSGSAGVPPATPPALGGSITVATTATFGGQGSAGSVTLAPNSTLQVGLAAGTQDSGLGTPDSALQSFSLSALSLSDGATIDYTAIGNQLLLATPATQIDGTTTINIPFFASSGAYNLGNLANLLPVIQLTVDGAAQYADARSNASLSAQNDDLVLNTFRDNSRVLTWSGTSNIWAITGANWTNSSTKVFGDGDIVIFDDSAPGSPAGISVASGGVLVSSMTVNSAQNYTFTGGAITTAAASYYIGDDASPSSPDGKLTKAGAGTLTFANTANNFTDGIDLAEGALAFTGSSRTQAATVNVAPGTTLQFAGAATLDSSDLHLAAGSTLAGNGLITGTLTLAAADATPVAAARGSIASAAIASAAATPTVNFIGEAAVTASIATGNSLAIAADVTGPGGFLKTGAGELVFNNATLANTGATQIDQGTIRFAGYTRASASLAVQDIILNGGILSLASGNATATLQNDTTAVEFSGINIVQGDNAAASSITGANDIVHIGSGTFLPRLTGNLHVAIDAAASVPDGGDAVAILANTANNFTGVIRVDSGTLQVDNQNQIAGLGASGNSNNKFVLNGGAIHFTDTFTFGNAIQLRAPAGAVTVDADKTITFARVTLSGPNASTFTKDGDGTFILNDALQATALNVNAGRFISKADNSVPNSPSLTTNTPGPITVAAGAVYQLDRNGSAAANQGFFAGATLLSTAATVNNALKGSGTFELTAQKTLFNNAESTIANTVVKGADTAMIINASAYAPGPDSTITVDQGQLAFNFGYQEIGNVVLKNGASMGFVMTSSTFNYVGSPLLGYDDNDLPIYDTATTTTLWQATGAPVKTATLATLAATDGVAKLWFNVDLGQGYANQLTVKGAVTGTFSVGIIPYVTSYGAVNATSGTMTPTALHATPLGETDYLGAIVPPTYHETIPLLQFPADISDAQFILPTGAIDIDLYKYTVTGTTLTIGGADVYSVAIQGNGAMSNMAAYINSVAAAQPLSWFSELEGVTQRLGEIRLDQRDTKGGLSVWMRGYGEQLDFNTRLTGASFGERHLGAEAGIDAKPGGIDSLIYFGLFAGAGQSQRDRSDTGDASSDSAFGGFYMTVATKSGWYLDAISKYNSFKNRFTANNPGTGASVTASYRNTAIGGSLEFGKHQELPYDWFIEPQAQIAFTAISSAHYVTADGMVIQMDPGTFGRAHAGFRFGRIFDTNNLGSFSVYIKGYYGYQWTYDGHLRVYTPHGQSASYAPTIKGYNLQGGLGIAWLFSRSTQLYFDYDATEADYYSKPWGLNFGIRHMW